MNKLTKFLKMLSSETRLRIINLLLVCDCCVNEISQILTLSQPLISRHLSMMNNEGLTKMRRQGLYAIYSIDWESLDIHETNLLKIIQRELLVNRLTEQDLRKLANARRLLKENFLIQSTNLHIKTTKLRA